MIQMRHLLLLLQQCMTPTFMRNIVDMVFGKLFLKIQTWTSYELIRILRLVLIGLLLIPAGITIFVLLIVKRTGYIFVTPLVVSICGAIMVARGARFYTQAKQYA